MVKLKNLIKYLIFGGFIGLILVYLRFKKVNVKEFISKKKESRISGVSTD